ncbi:hypothetical protein BUE80_DR001860 [Diplocarpon rosae]|nr:hypothetical protein BUE80_DR001860 [Diplocarpon rosae]
MAHPHPHPHLHPIGPPAGFNHVCMMDGPDPEIRLSALQFDTVCDENKRFRDEIQRLTALLRQNGISQTFPPSPDPINDRIPVCKGVNTNFKTPSPESIKPYLPDEILLQILGFALKSPRAIIDPFYKMRKDNVTSYERFSRDDINIQCLAVSHSFHAEGVRLLVENNEFVFTQASALENFAKISTELRSTIQNVTLRIVGRYYEDKPRGLKLNGLDSYHELVEDFEVPALGRPAGMVNDKGIQAYCWYQVGDFLRALQLPFSDDPSLTVRPRLFPELTSMRIDLVNFCDHLPLGIATFAPVIRWHLGRFLDELLITGAPHEDASGHELMILRNALKEEGLFSSACPAFISEKGGLKKLPVSDYQHHTVAAKKKKKKAAAPQSPSPQRGPKADNHPVSFHPAGETIWKLVLENEDGPKLWMEFHRESGRPIIEMELGVSDSDVDADGPVGMQFAVPPLGFLPLALAQAIPAIVQGALPTFPADMSEDNPDESDDDIPELSAVGEDMDDEMPSLLEPDNSTGI